MNKAHLILYDRCPNKDWDNLDAAIHFVWDEFTSEEKVIFSFKVSVEVW